MDSLIEYWQAATCATYLILYTAAPYWTKYFRHNHLILPSILPSIDSIVFARSKARFSLNMLASAPRPLYIERERGQCRGPRQLIWIDWFAARSKDVRERRSLWCCVWAWASRSFLLLRFAWVLWRSAFTVNNARPSHQCYRLEFFSPAEQMLDQVHRDEEEWLHQEFCKRRSTRDSAP